MTKLLVAATAAVLVAACSRTGTGAGVRKDITAQMDSAQPAITECYANVLLTNRKARGMMVMMFRAAPDSGQFDQVSVGRDEPNDPNLRRCVIEIVSRLKLKEPQSASVQISYPINFQPNN